MSTNNGVFRLIKWRINKILEREASFGILDTDKFSWSEKIKK